MISGEYSKAGRRSRLDKPFPFSFPVSHCRVGMIFAYRMGYFENCSKIPGQNFKCESSDLSPNSASDSLCKLGPVS
jgi:hypothetical protein